MKEKYYEIVAYANNADIITEFHFHPVHMDSRGQRGLGTMMHGRVKTDLSIAFAHSEVEVPIKH